MMYFRKIYLSWFNRWSCIGSWSTSWVEVGRAGTFVAPCSHSRLFICGLFNNAVSSSDYASSF
jgi:hypothetical protein